MIPWAFPSKSILSTASPACYPGTSGSTAFFLPLYKHATLGLPVQERTVYCETNTLALDFRFNSLLSTARPTRYPWTSGTRAYCLPLDQHATLGLPVQEPIVYH
ncbi:hypothetical protein ElyMa_005539300 [Elysia marginata]|uniref:Uncharacterized protein n=1 Tax=Elysia marginata TaxID=1093978 RepID=A0AAV4EYD3_9GAST|nr:hypothetical protein ElyMa_005539300 [Elysia marginata]